MIFFSCDYEQTGTLLDFSFTGYFFININNVNNIHNVYKITLTLTILIILLIILILVILIIFVSYLYTDNMAHIPVSNLLFSDQDESFANKYGDIVS